MNSQVFLCGTTNNEAPELVEKKLKKLLTAAGFEKGLPEKGLVAVKTHFGEKNSVTHVPPRFFRPLAARIKQAGALPFFTETSTLYRGNRSNAADHLLHAAAHGFTPENTGMPVIMADGLKGEWEYGVEIPGKQVMVAGLMARVHAVVCVSHPTGHVAMGYGGAIKNLGMGLASRKGKLTMHSSVKPSVARDRCTGCGHCIPWCPEAAIAMREDAAEIDAAKCIGCGECLAECRFDAIPYNWEMDKTEIQKMTAEHALGAIKGKPCFYINYLINFTKDCDCFGTAKTRVTDDIGLLASTDPVAVDEASITLIEKNHGAPLDTLTYQGLDPRIQTRHGEAIGLGSTQYELVAVNP